jgi:predicted membrane protein
MGKEKETEAVKVIVERSTSMFPWLVLLTIAFFGAKVFGLTNWSWWLVFIPLWIIPAIALGVVVFVGVLWLILISVGGILGIVQSTSWSKKRTAKRLKKLNEKREKAREELRKKWQGRIEAE